MERWVIEVTYISNLLNSTNCIKWAYTIAKEDSLTLFNIWIGLVFKLKSVHTLISIYQLEWTMYLKVNRIFFVVVEKLSFSLQVVKVWRVSNSNSNSNLNTKAPKIESVNLINCFTSFLYQSIACNKLNWWCWEDYGSKVCIFYKLSFIYI